MNFTKEQIDFVKSCGEHVEVLIGGRGHSKTKQIIEELQQELTKFKKENEELRKENMELKDEIFARDNSFYDMQD